MYKDGSVVKGCDFGVVPKMSFIFDRCVTPFWFTTSLVIAFARSSQASGIVVACSGSASAASFQGRFSFKLRYGPSVMGTSCRILNHSKLTSSTFQHSKADTGAEAWFSLSFDFVLRVHPYVAFFRNCPTLTRKNSL